MKRTIIKIKSSEDNEVHLPDLNPTGMLSTACGDCDTFFTYTETTKPLSCKACISIYENIRHGIKLK